jgi:hypothetical protein
MSKKKDEAAAEVSGGNDVFGALLPLVVGFCIGIALVAGFIYLRNRGTFDELIDRHPVLEILDDG